MAEVPDAGTDDGAGCTVDHRDAAALQECFVGVSESDDAGTDHDDVSAGTREWIRGHVHTVTRIAATLEDKMPSFHEL